MSTLTEQHIEGERRLRARGMNMRNTIFELLAEIISVIAKYDISNDDRRLIVNRIERIRALLGGDDGR